MEPVEINAGAWYLRALRADELMDDRPALADMGITDPNYVAERYEQWQSDSQYTWAVCEPTTGEMIAEVALTPSTRSVRTHARPGHEPAARAAADAVRRFADTLGF